MHNFPWEYFLNITNCKCTCVLWPNGVGTDEDNVHASVHCGQTGIDEDNVNASVHCGQMVLELLKIM